MKKDKYFTLWFGLVFFFGAVCLLFMLFFVNDIWDYFGKADPYIFEASIPHDGIHSDTYTRCFHICETKYNNFENPVGSVGSTYNCNSNDTMCDCYCWRDYPNKRPKSKNGG